MSWKSDEKSMENLGRGWAAAAAWRKPFSSPGHGGADLGKSDDCEARAFKEEYTFITGFLTVASAPCQGVQFNEELFWLLFV